MFRSETLLRSLEERKINDHVDENDFSAFQTIVTAGSVNAVAAKHAGKNKTIGQDDFSGKEK